MSEYLLPAIVTIGWIYLAYAINPTMRGLKDFFHFAVLLNIMANVMLFHLSVSTFDGMTELIDIYMYFNLFLAVAYIIFYVIFMIFKPFKMLLGKDERMEDFD